MTNDISYVDENNMTEGERERIDYVGRAAFQGEESVEKYRDPGAYGGRDSWVIMFQVLGKF